MGSTRSSKKRSLFVGMCCVILLTTVIFRLLWLQTVEASFLRERAEKTWEKNEVIQPKRGTIMDRNGIVLAEEVNAYIIAADLKQVKQPRQTARKLAPLLKMPEEVLYKRLTKKGVNQVELRSSGHYKVSQRTRNEIMKLDLKGIYGIKTSGRDYSEEEQAAHVLGFVNGEGEPVGGVEQEYDALLKGKKGSIRFNKDGNGIRTPDGAEEFRPPEDGKDLLLTLDSRIQQRTEEALDKIMKQYQAKGATAIVADPNSGEILAMANRPTFNPARYGSTWKSGSNTVNTAISSQYEPGSTFKIVTMAAALEEGEFDPDKTFQSGSVEVGKQTIRDWNDQGWGDISYAEGVYLSSNVAFVHLAEKLGQETLIRYIDRFGFGRVTGKTGQKTGIDLPAEEQGYFFGHEPLHKVELASTAFGQGIAVTPLQQVMAVSAIANGGTLYRPHVLKEVRKPGTKEKVKKVKPYILRKQVVSKDTAAQARDLLRGVVTRGTGKEAEVKGFSVAGKTGTAQKPHPDGKGYIQGEYVVSFIGFAPADDPRLVVYIAVDEPGDGSGGGTVAAPAVRDIIKDALTIMGEKPDNRNVSVDVSREKIAANWVEIPVDEVKKKLEKQQVRVEVLGSGDKVLAQYPAGGNKIPSNSPVYLLTEPVKALNMPDLYGKSLREAKDICKLLHLYADVEGEGYVISQSIQPGERIMDKKKVRLQLTGQPPS